MGIFDTLLNGFKNKNNNQTPAAPAPRVTYTVTGMGNTTPVTAKPKPAAKSKPAAKKKAQKTSSVSSNTGGGANWFNGIGTASSAKQNNNITVYSLKGTPLQLSASDCKASGGEGTVYAIPGKPDVLVKIYKDELLAKPEKRAEIEKRIYDMLAISGEMNQSCFAWPRAVVCNKQKQVIGFAMNKCEGISFQALSGVKSITHHFPGWTRMNLAHTAQDFLIKLQYLASKNVLVNDFNPANFLVDKNGKVSFIDCDSYQVPGEKKSVDITKTYFASHVAPELLLDPKQLAKPRNIHHVEFGAALTVFNILMCGLHPYSYFDPQHQDACGTPDENLRKGRCPLGIGAGCKFPNGNWYNLWSYFTYRLKSALITTFQEGHKNPAARTSLADLLDCVNELVHVMKKDPVRQDLNPTKAKPKAQSSGQGKDFSMNF